MRLSTKRTVNLINFDIGILLWHSLIGNLLMGIVELDGDSKPVNPDENSSDLTPKTPELQGASDNGEDNYNDEDSNSLGSWKDGVHGISESDPEASSSGLASKSPSVETQSSRMSWADMAQEDELEEEEERELSKRVVNVNAATGELRITKPTLSREQREYIRFMNVKRQKDFICLERVNGKFANILEGLELHTGIFSAAEQKRIVDFVYSLQEMDKKGELKGQSLLLECQYSVVFLLIFLAVFGHELYTSSF